MQSFIDLGVKTRQGCKAGHCGVIWSVGALKLRPMAVLWTDHKQHIGLCVRMCVFDCCLKHTHSRTLILFTHMSPGSFILF